MYGSPGVRDVLCKELATDVIGPEQISSCFIWIISLSFLLVILFEVGSRIK